MEMEERKEMFVDPEIDDHQADNKSRKLHNRS